MLYFFFNRRSKFIRVLEVAGLAGFAAIFVSGAYGAFGTGAKILFFAYVCEYLFIRLCSTIKWYKKFPDVSSDAGIYKYFKMVMVPTSYLIAITNLLLALGSSPAFMYVPVVSMIVIVYLNAVMVYIHLRDGSALPPNYFSSNEYKHDLSS